MSFRTAEVDIDDGWRQAFVGANDVEVGVQRTSSLVERRVSIVRFICMGANS
jgi:hypothetical protein